MSDEDDLALRHARDDEFEQWLRATEDRQSRFYAHLREVFRREPVLLAKLDEPIPWETLVEQRRVARAARRQEREEEYRRQQAARRAPSVG